MVERSPRYCLTGSALRSHSPPFFLQIVVSFSKLSSRYVNLSCPILIRPNSSGVGPLPAANAKPGLKAVATDAMEKAVAALNRLRRDTSSLELDMARDVVLVEAFWTVNASDAARQARARTMALLEATMVGSECCIVCDVFYETTHCFKIVSNSE